MEHMSHLNIPDPEQQESSEIIHDTEINATVVSADSYASTNVSDATQASSSQSIIDLLPSQKMQ